MSHPRLSPLRVVMRVPSEERRKSSCLKPPSEKLCGGVTEEPPSIRSRERQARKIDGKEHRSCDLEVGPLGPIVPGPHRPPPLTARPEGSCKYERTHLGGWVRGPECLPLSGGLLHVVSV